MESSSRDGIDFQKTKRNKKKIVVVVAVAVLIVSGVYFAYMQLKLQREYDSLSESYRLATHSLHNLVNDQWTGNTGIDSNYVNYKGSIFNSGYKSAYNVTLIVRIYCNDNTLLEMEEILIGDIGAMRHQAFNVNVEYSGELAEVSTGIIWE